MPEEHTILHTDLKNFKPLLKDGRFQVSTGKSMCKSAELCDLQRVGHLQSAFMGIRHVQEEISLVFLSIEEHLAESRRHIGPESVLSDSLCL
ncbi:hypothetical protein TNCT_662931 [Trichonephila clavata]|uniref:Uncharacterized protein n=1 Tax=Trichonephila clavata TaxID=2740835 RepID=A0A8X6FUC9_TRICU|nr:hypothetical protein TNCT_662931 [Trichonephila clavata]